MTKVVAFWAAALALIGGLLLWRNSKRYPERTRLWLVSKAGFELIILLLTATLMPALLIAWLVVWATKPIKSPWVRTIVGIVSGVCFGFMSNLAIEALVFFGIFAVDMKTGAHERGGFLNCWKRAKEEQGQPLAEAA
jgi:hypothetical protein